ncbi:hypothetical protein IJ732_01780 [bacterium]|nr:hypothetical protein [bacterium]
MMKKTDERETVSKVKKVFNTISNAFSLAVAENGFVNLWGLNRDNSFDDAKIIFDNIRPYLNISTDCGSNTGCFYNGMYKN